MSECQKCNENKGTDEFHPCPYQVEINNADEDEEYCNCCAKCEQECKDDI